MTESGEYFSETVSGRQRASAGSITIGSQSSGRVIDVSPTPWTSEEVEHYNRTGETPLARLHRENLAVQWGDQA